MIKSIVKRVLATLGYEIRRIPGQQTSSASELVVLSHIAEASESVVPSYTADLSEQWSDPFVALREKWVEIPTSRLGRTRTSELLSLPDAALLREWERSRNEVTTGTQFAHRGWYHQLYSEMVAGKKILDVGSGFGIDTITFAQHGAHLTFVDLAEDNLAVLERLCGILEIHDSKFVWLEGIHSLKSLDSDYDIIMALGSLHHAPVQVIKPEVDELRRHLKIGGRWLQFAYPKIRWEREGSPSFPKWGEMTDGDGTPWSEWYDLHKLLQVHSPGIFDVILDIEFQNSDFNWFDLVYRGENTT